jgi:hypothetical protein
LAAEEAISMKASTLKNVALGLLAVCLLAASNCRQESSKQLAALEGTVRDAATSQPVADATVYLENTARSAATSASGSYRIDPCPGGQQRAVAAAAGYAPQAAPVTISSDAAGTQDFQLSRRPGIFLEVPNPLAGDNPAWKCFLSETPAAGQAVRDFAFDAQQTRVTQTEGIRHEYSRHDPFNCDGTRILLLSVASGDWYVYNTAAVPYDQPGSLARTLDLEEPRWDPADPDLVWGSRDFRILTLNVRTGQPHVVKDFSKDPAVQPILAANPDLYRITMKDEGESSQDKRFWAFLVQGTQDDYRARYILTWDRQMGKVLGLYAISKADSDIDWVGMSAKGSWVLIGGMEGNAGQLAGLVMADKALTQFHRLDYTTAHSDVGLDSDGNEVIVMQNSRTDYVDLLPIDPATKPILESGGSYAGTNRTPLVRLFYDSESPIGLSSGIHISCNAPGYCLISATIEGGQPERNWLDRTIALVRLDRARPRAFYLAKVYGTRQEYWEETQASISVDGRRIVWATNWGRNLGADKVWVMRLDLPAGWQGMLRD